MVASLGMPDGPMLQGPVMKRETVSRLLQQWTRLSDAEVQMTEATRHRGPAAQLERKLET